MCLIELLVLKDSIQKSYKEMVEEHRIFPEKVGIKLGVDMALEHIETLIERGVNDSSN